MNLPKFSFITLLLCSVCLNAGAQECSDRNAMQASMEASERLLVNGESFRRARVLKRHHPSKRKEVATYFRRDDLYYTLFWLVSDNCQAGFIKRTKGKF